MARDIALIEPNPGDWGGWVRYFFDQMEMEVKRIGKQSHAAFMLKPYARQSIHLARLFGGGLF